MSGFRTYTTYQRIESQAKLLGFCLGNPKTYYGESDLVSLYPDGTSLPVYARGAEIYTGTFRDIEIFLNGWEKAHQYDAFLRLTDDKKRKQYEAKEVERQRLAKEREEKKKVFAILTNKTEKQVERLVFLTQD